VDAKARSKTAELIDAIRENPKRFSFEQIVRLIRHELAHTNPNSKKALREQVRIVPWLSLAFPPADVLSCQIREKQGKRHYELEATDFGLYSTQGPLPTFYTEELVEYARADSSLVKDFLDIINNHLYYFHGLALSHYNQPRKLLEENDPTIQLVFYSLMGQGQAGLRPETGMQLGALELFMGPRSSQGLAVYLGMALGMGRVEIDECIENTVAVPEDQLCRLGSANSQLGENIVVGKYIKEFQAKMRIHFYDVPEETFCAFIRDSTEFDRVRDCVERFAEEMLEFDICLHPAPDLVADNHRLGLGQTGAGFLCPPGGKAEKTVLVRF
jgi:type VI secretion protein, VC_A0111 family